MHSESTHLLSLLLSAFQARFQDNINQLCVFPLRKPMCDIFAWFWNQARKIWGVKSFISTLSVHLLDGDEAVVRIFSCCEEAMEFVTVFVR